MNYQVDRYYTYKEMTDLLQAFADEYPQLITLESAGQSLEKREIWAVTVTDKKTGPHHDKPAIYIDANIHGGEVSGSNVCIHTIHKLVRGYGSDPEVTRLLERRTFYILPRTNPDGAEAFLTSPDQRWGSARPYPLLDDAEGLVRADMNDDGAILLMRLADENGEWKISKSDARLMVPRAPHEYGGEYYRLLPEGYLSEGADPEDYKVLPRMFQLNLNRNFPAGWEPEALQSGGGAYPLSEPECKAVVDFIMERPNIGALQAYHTYGGVILRPFSHLADTEFPGDDLIAYEILGELGEELTGYEMVSIYHAFTDDKSKPRRGVLGDWAYNHCGIMSCGAELWNMAAEAGVRRADPGNYYPFQNQPEEDELRMLKFNDEALEGEGFMDWVGFDHPQLGKVEIGGWRWKFTRKNPPVKFLEKECERNIPFSLVQAAMLPELTIKSTSVKPFGDGAYEVTAVVENTGYLPTNVMTMAVEMDAAESVKAVLTVPEGWEVAGGSDEVNLGHIPGRLRASGGFYFGEPDMGVSRKTRTARWYVKSRAGAETDATMTIGVRCPRAGKVEAEIDFNQ